MMQQEMGVSKYSILTRFDSILLGDNPFFGVDHLSQERAREKATKSQNFDNELDVIRYSLDLGIKGMVVSTHPALKDFIAHIRAKSKLIDKINFYPILPYVQGYVLKINEKGVVNTLIEMLSQAGVRNKIKILTSGGLGIIRKDLFELFKTFIDLELFRLNDVKIKTIFLHDTVTDLALSLNMKTIFEAFQEYLHDNYKINAGLVTKNFPRLIDKCDEWNIHFSNVMTSFNKIGFQMNPSKEECERYLSNYHGDVIAMSVFAGGYLKPSEAYEYIFSLKKIKHVVIGVSSVEHARSTFKLFSSTRE